MDPVTLLDWATGHLITHLIAVKFCKPGAQSMFYKLSTLIYKNSLCSDLCISTQKLYQMLTRTNKSTKSINSGLIGGQ